MAKTIQVLNTVDGKTPDISLPRSVKAGASETIKPGYLVIEDGSNAGYVKAAANATASTASILGVANSTSDDTATADGTVTFDTGSCLRVQLYAKTPASLADTMIGSKFVLDVTSGNYTLDQGTTTNGIFKLLSYDSDGLCTCTLELNN